MPFPSSPLEFKHDTAQRRLLVVAPSLSCVSLQVGELRIRLTPVFPDAPLEPPPPCEIVSLLRLRYDPGRVQGSSVEAVPNPTGQLLRLAQERATRVRSHQVCERHQSWDAPHGPGDGAKTRVSKTAHKPGPEYSGVYDGEVYCGDRIGRRRCLSLAGMRCVDGRNRVGIEPLGVERVS
eukprot:7877-Prymnesium_polylepis.2